MTLHEHIAGQVIELLTSTPAFNVRFVYTNDGAEVTPDGSLIVWAANIHDQISEHVRRAIEDYSKEAKDGRTSSA
jgi:hypothetical protein